MSRCMPVLILIAVAMLVAACAGGQKQTPSSSTPAAQRTPASDASSRQEQASTVGQPLERAKIHTELGMNYYESGKMAVALEELNTAIQALPTYAPAWNGRALVYMELREDRQAENDFKQAIKVDPGNSEAKNNYGLFLCQRDRFQEGIRYLLDALKNPLYSTPALAYRNAGQCARMMGDAKSAEGYFVRAVKLDPNQPQALYSLAQINFERDAYAPAKNYLERHLRVVEPPSADALWLGARIARRLGERDALANYGQQLRRRYPSSVEAKAYSEGRFE